MIDESLEAAGEGAVVGEGRLIARHGASLGPEVFPVRPPCLIGRSDPDLGPVDVDLGQLPDGPYVSRRHAEIVWRDGAFWLRDLGSSNGTYVLRDDFERVEEAELSDGTEVAFGRARLVFRVESIPGREEPGGGEEGAETEERAGDASGDVSEDQKNDGEGP